MIRPSGAWRLGTESIWTHWFPQVHAAVSLYSTQERRPTKYRPKLIVSHRVVTRELCIGNANAVW